MMSRESWYCPGPLQNVQDVAPRLVYTSTTEISLIINEKNKEIGCDLRTQFMDDRMKVCRDKLCHPDRRLRSFKCSMKHDLSRPRPCVTTFVKITALDGMKLEARLKQDINFLLKIEHTLHQRMHVNGVIGKIDVFVKSKRHDKTTIVEYDILKLLLLVDELYPFDVLEKLLLNIHQKTVRLGNYEQTQFFFELATFTEYLHDTNIRVIYIPLSDRNSSVAMDLITSIEFSKNSVELCNYSAISLMHKTDICPYIQMRIDEVWMDFENEFLILKSHDILKYSPFEYKRQNESLYICISDFLPFYYSLSLVGVVSASCTGCNFGKMMQSYY